MPILKYVNKDFFKQWTPEMAYVLGFFAADGYVTHNKRNTDYWNIQITDLDILEKMRDCILAEHKISVRIRTENESTLYRLQIGSNEMCKDLQELGISQRKTKSLAIPNVPDQYLPHFVRGYFDGDGNVWVGQINKHRRTPTWTIMSMFTSASYRFLTQLQLRLESFGIKGGYMYTTKKKCFRLQYSTRNSLKLANFMYNQADSCGLFLMRKRQIFQRYACEHAAVV